ncbi:MAG: DNA-directed RNA polymerase subunit omega [Vicinamibacteria bacterium]|jgi:DNA-directed RNA polymerase subunit omega|nr:DNA-directed RNA polymerase subunit omega [Vicinamibacteria bacterium]
MTQIVMPKDVDSKFRFIVVAAQRSKQIQQGAKARVDVKTRKPTRVAMQEVLQNAVSWEIVDPEAPAPVAEEAGQEG